MNHWLVKSESTCYSIDDLKKDKKTSWEGVRNYQARNFMVRCMKVGDAVLFYHSGGPHIKGVKAEPGVYGVARVASKPHADETQFDKKDEHYDPKAVKPSGGSKGNVIWQCVDIAFVKKWKHPVTLTEIRLDPAFAGMPLLAPGQRLSIQPVSATHFSHIFKLSES
jgi:predicted RNA-binding protein with PUA-like domain